MSQIAGSLSFTGCDSAELEAHRPGVVRYELGSGRWFESVPASGWCPDCEAIVDVERIESMKASQRRIEESLLVCRDGC